MERYTCLPEILPVIVSALAAAGFVHEAPLLRIVNGARITVMTGGGAVICLYEDSARDMADIHVYANGEAAGPAALHELSRLMSPLAQRRGALLAGLEARLRPRGLHE